MSATRYPCEHILEQVKEKILKAENIAIFSHIDPDGDSMGCLLSLGLGIGKLGKRVYMISQDGVPEMYGPLPGADRITTKAKEVFELAIAADCSAPELLGKSYDIFKKAKDTIAIDHHEFRTAFADISLIDKNAAAVGEIVYMLLKRLKVNITEDIAENILTSIIVETNSFRLPNVRRLTFDICADLMKKGVDFSKLTEMIYWSRTKEATILAGVCISRLKFLKKGRIVWSIVNRKDFSRVKGKDADVDTVANDMLSIKGVDIAILFREKSREILRVSLRSKGRINIVSVAEAFGGGGHFDAAGCRISNNRKSIKELLNRAKDLVG